MVVLGSRKGADLWQRKEQTARETYANVKTAAGKADTRLATIQLPVSVSSKMFWAKLRQKSKKSWLWQWTMPKTWT